jgi:hypothetical protein
MDRQPPANAGTAGARHWTAITSEFDLDPHELDLLDQAATTLGIIERLESRLGDEDVITGGGLVAKPHPAVTELRQQKLTFARLMACLRLPLDDPHESERPVRRPVRGVYAKRPKVPPGLKVVTP